MISENIPWSEKYRPKNFAEIKGQDAAVSKVKLFLHAFPKKKSIIFHGTPGVGKTTLAYATALEKDAEILELNASDFRDKKKISEIIGPAISQKSLFKSNKIILVDEVDGISARRDRGGLSELVGLIEKSAYPIIITANDIWDKKFSILRKKAEIVALKDIDYRTVVSVLQDIAKKEAMIISVDVLTSIAVRTKGDLRAALNDLQMYSKLESIDAFGDMGERNREQTIFQALQYVFKNSKIDQSMIKVYDEVNMSVDQIFLWIEENIPLEYKGEELAKAYDALSMADVFRGRIYRKQHWRFMIYQYFLLGSGIAAAKNGVKGGFTSYKKPSRILKIWLNNQRTAKKKSICQKYSKLCHISLKQAMRDFMLIKIILNNSKIREELKLNDDEITYLDK